ncbi:unnamed protein product [Clavelina lepadiformis]|uniref:Uncharacterized protein n=1 Tax=Clavelina lepadiformis TaxID=159417 RepID=A0ABP0GMU9_CLALP
MYTSRVWWAQTGALGCCSSYSSRRLIYTSPLSTVHLSGAAGHTPTKSTRAALQLLEQAENPGFCAACGAGHKLHVEWQESLARLHNFIIDADSHPNGLSLPRMPWV